MLNTLGPLTLDANWDSYVSVATMLFSFSIHQNKEHTCRHGVNLILRFSEQKLANFRKYESFKTASFIVLKLKKRKKALVLLVILASVYQQDHCFWLWISTLKGPSVYILFFFSFPFPLRSTSFSFCHPSCVMLLRCPRLQSPLASATLPGWLRRQSTLSLVFFPHSSFFSAYLPCSRPCASRWLPDTLAAAKFRVECGSARR